jgi:RNA polymerase sigma-70 factor (ECF subfamily)
MEELTEGMQDKVITQSHFLSVKEIIRRLPETDRAIISMHLDGYEHTEIAALTGISNNHVAVKLHRIKQQLANYLKTER